MEAFVIAGRYAQAVFEVVEESKWERVVDELTAVHIFFQEHADISKLFASPVVPPATKQKLLAELIAQAKVMPAVEYFLHVLLEKGRLELLHYIIDGLKELIHQARNMIQATITCAFPLTSAEQKELIAKLSTLAGRKLDCTIKQDPRLLCGIVAQVGNTIYDGSLKNKLQRLETKLMTEK